MPSVSQRPPPFPDDLPTLSLDVLDFDLLSKYDPREADRLYAACHEKGFFYLTNHGVDTDAAFKFGRDLYDIPMEEKEACAMGSGVNYLGYKRIGEFVVDSKGTRDSQETWNVIVFKLLQLMASLQKTMPLGFQKTHILFHALRWRTKRSYRLTSNPARQSQTPSSRSCRKS
jgi:non-haem dioxygenase in morphine synthesis N-terminal